MGELTVHAGIVLYDDGDANVVLGRDWSSDSAGYARTVVEGRWIWLHRLLMGLDLGDRRQVDHINGNRLDNRRCNLRICTATENKRNAQRRKDNTAGYKGVIRAHGKYRAVLAVGGFDTPEEAARVYDILAEAAYGEFAHLNFPEPSSEA